MSERARTNGFTFVETVIAIVVVGIAVVGVLSIFMNIVRQSADPMVAHQGIAVAEAYMEEILTKNFTGVSPACNGRATWNAVDCYFGESHNPPQNQGGVPINALSDYTVTIASNPGQQCGFGSGDEQLIIVTVSHTSGFSYELRGCMANY